MLTTEQQVAGVTKEEAAEVVEAANAIIEFLIEENIDHIPPVLIIALVKYFRRLECDERWEEFAATVDQDLRTGLQMSIAAKRGKH